MKNTDENHLTIDEINKFCSFRDWNEQNTELAERVNAHIEKCQKCREAVNNMMKDGAGAISADTAETNAVESDADYKENADYSDGIEFDLDRIPKTSIEEDMDEMLENVSVSGTGGNNDNGKFKIIKNKERSEELINRIEFHSFFEKMFGSGVSDSYNSTDEADEPEDEQDGTALVNQSVGDMFSALKELIENRKSKNKKPKNIAMKKYIDDLKKMDDLARRTNKDYQPQTMYLDELERKFGIIDCVQETSKKKRKSGKNNDRNMMSSN